MTYWKQFAEMLGLELGQEFNIVSADGKKINYASYKITENGLYFKGTTNGAWDSEASIFLKNLLSGDYKAVPKPWKPAEREVYCYFELCEGMFKKKTWYGSDYDLAMWKLGNCFKTAEEAKTKGKEIMEQIMKEYKET